MQSDQDNANQTSSFTHEKYRPFPKVSLPDRQWPDQEITAAPLWCSVDLRDGNQALIEPMSVTQKKLMFSLLVKIGFKEIEVGFPAASQPDFDFVRWLIEAEQIPEDVTIQVLTQARPELIERTFEALRGVRRAVVHVYNSTSTVQRQQVFEMDREGIKNIAIRGAQKVQEQAARYPETEWVFQYSPESFTGTELDYAVDVVNAVTAIWQPTKQNPAIINLPATVEMATPNIFADQIEWFNRQVERREAIILSVHTHNDRGCAVAAAELAVMAGADRVEGTLMGNGERTGNMDIITIAMNLYSQGIDPELQLGDMDEIIRVVRECTQLPVHPRHPYAGELVYTAFSGSHQDAIKKCLAKRKTGDIWDVAYLPIDPADIGRSYQEVIRVNSQSGKGGVAYMLERDYGLALPRWLQIDFSPTVQQAAEVSGGEVTGAQIRQLFDQRYVNHKAPVCIGAFEVKRTTHDELHAQLFIDGQMNELNGIGHGSLDALANGLKQQFGIDIVVQEYSEHAIKDGTSGTEADAIAYVQARIAGELYCGAAIHEDIMTASINALLCATNQYLAEHRQAVAC
ncbi:MAG: 2-isopropylmalate synthase [Pseudomonadales bacterium]|nr:2-isopropylmalate synthase [Pseudomonadales bacterium]